MADITMCGNGDKCLFRKSCYRYMAKPSQYQSYANFHKLGKVCDDFWKLGDLYGDQGGKGAKNL